MGVPVYLVSFYVLLAISQSVQANLNLFMNKDEVKKLLGLHAELYYVRNGEINNYAMMFNLPIPHDIPELNFSWQNLRAGPPDMLYSISVNHSNPEALDQPRISIAKEGRVPTTPEAFTIVLPCTGKMSAEVEVHIQINVSIFSASNATILDFKRRKFCWEDVGGGSPVAVVHRDADAVAFESMPNDADLYDPTKNDDRDPDHYLRYPSNEPSIRDAIVTRSTNTNVFYIAMGCALALIVVIATLVIIYYIRSRKHNDRVSEISSHAYSTHPPPFGRMESHGHNPANMAGSYIRFSPVSDLKPPDLRTQISEISIERSRLTLADVIQEGTFGKIYHGVLLGEGADMEVENDVFVKTVTEQASESQVNLFITESCMMLGLSFPSIQTIRSMCMDNERQPLAVFPYASNGLLKKFLHKCKIPGEGQGTQVASTVSGSHVSCCGSKLSTQELVHMGIQIIRGVQYLHKKKIIHKDLATRNCVVGQDLNVKITEKALSRDLFPNDYHCLGDNENRPVKWLAIESLIDKRFSPASDVWAFGVLLWELMTLGQQPYPDVDPFEMAQYLREGYRLSQPINCPDELFAVMACCWALCPDDRPKFTQLLQCLQDFYAHLGRYI